MFLKILNEILKKRGERIMIFGNGDSSKNNRNISRMILIIYSILIIVMIIMLIKRMMPYLDLIF